MSLLGLALGGCTHVRNGPVSRHFVDFSVAPAAR